MSTFILHGCPIYPTATGTAVEAIGVADGRVVVVGDLAQVRSALPDATVRTLTSGAVLPAFIDPHQHAFLVAADPAVDTLLPATSIADVQATVRSAAQTSTSGGWLRLHGYLQMRLHERRSPTAAELDSVCPDRPLHVISRSFHESAVNSAGLDALGITRSSRDLPGGRVVRDRRGRPTGVLLETNSFAAEAASRPTDISWTQRLADHGRLLTQHGIIAIGDGAVPAAAAAQFQTTLDDVGVTAVPLLIEANISTPAVREGQTAKVLLDGGERCHFDFSPAQVRAMTAIAIKSQFGPDPAVARAVMKLSGNPVRHGRHWHYGTGFIRTDLPALLRQAADVGSGLALHAIGNGAVGALLDVIETDRAAAEVNLRFEHTMVLDQTLVARLGAAGRPVVTQPGFAVAHPEQFLTVGLPHPLQLMPIRDLLDAGTPVAFSSDYPASDLSPWPAIQIALTPPLAPDNSTTPKQSLCLRPSPPTPRPPPPCWAGTTAVS